MTFSAERNRYQKYNPVFDRAMKTLKIVANQQLLFPKSETRPGSDVIGINVHPAEDMIDHMPPAAKTSSRPKTLVILGVLAVLIFGGAVYFTRKRKKISPTKSRKSRTQ